MQPRKNAPPQTPGAKHPTAITRRPSQTWGVVQPKTATAPQPKRPPVAPAVCRPQPTPRVLQTKSALVQPPRAAGQQPRTPVAPPVYRPQPTPHILQPKTSATHANPHALRPNPSILCPPPAARPSPPPPRVAAVQPKLQMPVKPRALAPAHGRGVVQRLLDEEFGHGGTPGEGETAACRAFAQKVSDFVDQAYNELITGNVKAWTGAKAATFLNLVIKGHRIAVTHAANAIEERVYALMGQTAMPLKWEAQYSAGMGSASRPDIVIHLKSGKEALVDITSERGHILRKAGGWTTSERYVYVAEAYFKPVRAGDIPNIKAAMEKGGIGLSEATALKVAADEKRKDKLREKMDDIAKVRKEFNKYGSFAHYAHNHPRFSDLLNPSARRAAARKFLLMYGIRVKGVMPVKGKRKPSIETRKIMAARAMRARKAKERKSAAELLKELQGKSSSSSSSSSSSTSSSSSMSSSSSSSSLFSSTPPPFSFSFTPSSYTFPTPSPLTTTTTTTSIDLTDDSD